MNTQRSDRSSNVNNDRSEDLEGEHQPSPLAHGLMLLCLYIVMYLAVAALLHNVAPFSTALSAVGDSFALAARLVWGDADDALPEFGSLSVAGRKTPPIDKECD